VQAVKDEVFLGLLGKRIRLLRKKKQLTQLELAVKINNHAEQIGRIERGKLNVSICTLKEISNGLDVTLAELLHDLDEKTT
jgi:transcriptional regulator with XRE-family HTH domain